MKNLLSILPVLLALGACIGMIRPPEGPGTDYPCGISNVSCGNHMCCDAPTTVCGGPFTGCAAGMCCVDSTPNVGASRGDAGAVMQRGEMP